MSFRPYDELATCFNCGADAHCTPVYKSDERWCQYCFETLLGSAAASKNDTVHPKDLLACLNMLEERVVARVIKELGPR